MSEAKSNVDESAVERLVICSHEEVSITEIWVGHTIAHYREKDGAWTHNQEPGVPTGKLLVECDVCGFSKVYTSSNTPKWVKKRLNEALAFEERSAVNNPQLPN